MKTLKEIILEEEEKDKVVFLTIDGPKSIDIDKFIQQPAEGILYDLNRDRATILTFIDDIKWINDYAAMLTITKLKEHYDKNKETKGGV